MAFVAYKGQLHNFNNWPPGVNAVHFDKHRFIRTIDGHTSRRCKAGEKRIKYQNIQGEKKSTKQNFKVFLRNFKV